MAFNLFMNDRPVYDSQKESEKGYGNRFRAERDAKQVAETIYEQNKKSQMKCKFQIFTFEVYYSDLPNNHPVIQMLQYMKQVGNQWYKQTIELPKVRYAEDITTEALNQ